MSISPQATILPEAGLDPARRLFADRLYRLSAALVVILPVAMVVATRSSPAVLTAAALASLGGFLREGSRARQRIQAAALLRQALACSVAAFAAWALGSTLWSPAPLLSLRVFGEFLLSCVAALTLALILPGRIDPRLWGRAAGIAAMLAAMLIVLDMQSGLTVRASLGGRAAAFVLNRPALTLLVLLPGIAVLLVSRGQGWLAAGVALSTAVAAWLSYSGASKFCLAAGTATFALAWLSRRAALGVVAVGLLGSIAIAPVLGELADRLLPTPVLERLERAHAQDRVDIWRSFGAAVRQQPWAGAGFGTSGLFAETPVAERLSPEYRTLLAVGHPHDAPLQIWAELGAVGAGLAALVAALTLRAIDGLEGPAFAAALALTGGALAASLVGQGAWQGWWPAGIGASILWFRVAGIGKA